MVAHVRSMMQLVFSIFVLVFFIGCTRPTSKGSSLKIAVPTAEQIHAKLNEGKVGQNALAAAPAGTTKIIIVNVTASDLAVPVIYKWDAHGSGSAPTEISVEVASGTGRQIQLILGYELAGGGTALYYGSAVSDIVGSEQAVDLPIMSLTSGSGYEGRIAGRYITSSNAGPTDILNVYLKPAGSTLPAMLIEQSEMIGGYFNVFSMSDVLFTYKLGDGTQIFPTNSSLLPSGSNPLYPSDYRTSMVYMPAAYRTWDSAGKTPKDEILIFGYFGPAATPGVNKVCYDYSSGTIANAFLDAGKSVPIPWNGFIVSLGSILHTASGILSGSSSLSCSGAALTDYMKIERDNLANGDDSVPFRGPFMKTGSFDYLNFVDASGLQVTWAYAPGAFSGTNAITGSQLFYLQNPGSQEFKKDDNGFDCGNLGAQGFSTLGIVGTGTTSQVIPGLSTSSDVEVIICPVQVKNGVTTYFRHGVEGNPGGGGGGAPFMGVPPYHLMLTATPPTPGNVVIPLDSIAHDFVSNVTLQLVDSQNKAVAQGVGNTFSLTLGYPLLTFDGVDDTTNVTLDSNGQSNFQIHVGNNEMVTTLTATYGGGISGVPATSTLILPVGPYTGEPDNIQIFTTMVAGTPAVGQCVPVEYAINNGPTGVLHPSTVNITFTPTSTNGNFYFAPDCSGGIASNVTINAGQVMSYLYYMPTSTGMGTLGFTGSPTNAVATPLSLYGSAYVYVP